MLPKSRYFVSDTLVVRCSPDGKFLASVGGSGPGRIWDVESSSSKASLPKENVRAFAKCLGMANYLFC